MGIRWLAPAGLAAAALIVTACGSSGSGNAANAGGAGNSPAATHTTSPAMPGAVVKARQIHGVTVLTNSAGMTLYWFAPDTPGKSACSGACAQNWPPVKGPVTASAGVTGTTGTITRPDGTMQATYKGHPLYTYIADTAPGMDKGNGLNAFGGLWHNVTVSVPAPAPRPSTPASSSAGGGGGY